MPLHLVNGARGLTLMGWVKSTAPALGPALNSTAPAPEDRYTAICLFGVLHGASDGHAARALIELIPVDGELRLIGLGRRHDEGQARVRPAAEAPDRLLPADTWGPHETGAMALSRDGEPLKTLPADPWRLADGSEPPGASRTLPVGIKIGGSYPQNTRERNPFDGRFADLLFFDRALSTEEVRAAAPLLSPAPERSESIRRRAAGILGFPLAPFAMTPLHGSRPA